MYIIISIFFKGNEIREVKSVAHYHTAGRNQDSNSILSDSKAHAQISHENWGPKVGFLECRPDRGRSRPLYLAYLLCFIEKDNQRKELTA